MSQLLGYRPGAKDAAQELVAAFVPGMHLMQLHDHRGLPIAELQPVCDDAPPPPSQPPAPQPWRGFRVV